MCCPDVDVVYSFTAPQGFIPIYAMALGKGGHLVMTVVATVGTILSTSVSAVAASRLVYAVARDGVLPFSGWIKTLSHSGQPKNALTAVGVVAAILLCTILPSMVAFYSLISCAAVPTICAYALIPFGRLFVSREKWPEPRFSLGKFSKPLQLIAFVWNLYFLALLITPLQYPVSAQTFNYAPVVLAIITIFGVASWWFIPAENWAPYRHKLAQS
jgi:amino acid transporter